MANLEAEVIKYNPDDYRYAAAAAQLAKAKDFDSAKKCLDGLAMKIDPNANKDLVKGLVWNAYKGDPKATIAGIQRGIDLYGSDYQEALNSQTMKEMFEMYSPEFDKNLTKEEKAKAQKAFSDLGNDKKYSDILEAADLLKEVFESKTSRYNKEEKDKAKKEFEEKYAPVISAIQGYEEIKISGLISPIREQTIREGIKNNFQVEEEQAQAA